jgi:hypothetical protein
MVSLSVSYITLLQQLVDETEKFRITDNKHELLFAYSMVSRMYLQEHFSL